jgi:hypothetical protein
MLLGFAACVCLQRSAAFGVGSPSSHGTNSCPTFDDLLRDGTLDADSPRSDPWGSAWHIECAELNVSVASPGRDRRLGTADDVRIPPT